MTFRERLTKLELEMVYARSSGDATKLARLEREHDEMHAIAWDTAYERAAELDSPNSPDFDALHEAIYEELTDAS